MLIWQLRNTEDAIAFGRKMTRVAYLKAEARRSRLQARFRKESDPQARVELAVKIQLLREAMESSPFSSPAIAKQKT